jgi:hypothetical protein
VNGLRPGGWTGLRPGRVDAGFAAGRVSGLRPRVGGRTGAREGGTPAAGRAALEGGFAEWVYSSRRDLLGQRSSDAWGKG